LLYIELIAIYRNNYYIENEFNELFLKLLCRLPSHYA